MFTLDEVVPWGRSFEEYQRMFALTEDDLRLRLLDCGAGPASFNVQATRGGARVISCDPLYHWDADDIQQRIAETYDKVIDQTRLNRDEFVWDAIPSVEALGALRMAAMSEFLVDYEFGKPAGRYVEAELPVLPFLDDSFDLALCSHLLFLYTDQLGDTFHFLAVRELCRIATEVRIFPLLALGATHSPFVDPVAQVFTHLGLRVTIEKVRYEFQRGGNQMMRIRR
jgi:SAM-dependent methyltransferase